MTSGPTSPETELLLAAFEAAPKLAAVDMTELDQIIANLGAVSTETADLRIADPAITDALQIPGVPFPIPNPLNAEIIINASIDN